MFCRWTLLFGGRGPPLHADGREASDLKVQKVHRKAGPAVTSGACFIKDQRTTK